MRTSHSFRSRLVGIAASVAFGASVLAASALPAGAQTCPTSGGGTTCFGGQAYCASSGQCYNPPSCSGNQTYSCTACGCVCNTALYPCGGCTAASSTAGASCSSPTGGQYTNQCGACACPSGTTICPTSNSCIANRSCPQGTTWDPCTDTCGTPNVLLSPGFQQNGFVQVSGELRSTAGNLRLDSATGSNQGDAYFANGKSIRVDGSGITTLNVGNWGVGGSGVNMSFATGSGICLNGTCRGNWPSTTDFNPTYINANGDTMTGDLNLTGAATDLFVAGNIGVGTTTPGSKLDVVGTAKMTGFQLTTGAAAGRYLMSDALGNGTWQSPSFIGGTGTANYLPKFTAASTLGNSLLFDNGTGVGIGTATPAYSLDVAGQVGVASSASSGSALYVNKAGVGNAYGIYVTTAASGNAISALRAVNAGTGPGIEVNGGSNAIAANIRAGGNNPALDAAVYDHSSPNTLETVMQIRRATSGTPAVGMGGAIKFVLEGVDGSHYGAGSIGSSISSTSPWKTDLVFAPQTYVGGEKMRLTNDGNLGIGTTAPSQKLDVAGSANLANNTASFWGDVLSVSSSTMTGGNMIAATRTNDGTTGDLLNLRAGSSPSNRFRVTSTGQVLQNQTNQGTNGSLNIISGTLANPFNTQAGYDISFTDSTSGTGGFTAFKLSSSFSGTGTGAKKLAEFNAGGGQSVVIDRTGYLGVGASAPATRLAVGGNGANVYATDVWVENNLHVQGNEAVGSGRGRLRVGTAWGLPGIYAETNSVGAATDLVLGASSDVVQINAGTFGRPNNASWLALWGSRIGDAGGGTLSIRSGGGVVAFDGGDTVRVDNSLQLGGVSRSSWPSLEGTVVRTDFTTGQGAGWKRVYCPAGYIATGASGYNCESNGGQWECSSTVLEGTSVQYYYSAEGTAYTWTKCIRLN